ncbi:MAG TPA: CbiX/SirB N-terminal domain-containing protein [Planctomycetaceae bacterium]|jgi:sirohydrochlorin ferrochelatase|nr:CbiX/SirB N-terminal domain-containing protein [Planctomycetaceae bacterium]
MEFSVQPDPTRNWPPAEKPAALLIAHGSRRPEANRDLVDLAYAIRGRTHYPIVEIAYLEVAEPTIPHGARRCVEQEATRIFLLPYFLSAGAHVVGDLERFRADLALEFPQVQFVLCQPLSQHPLLIEIVVERLKEAESTEAG